MKKFVEIDGITFEDCGTTTGDVIRQRGVFECYSRPSDRKISIWASWCRWFDKNMIWERGVSSYNCNFFTIEAIVRNKDSEDYKLVITRAHNRLYHIV